MLWALGLAIFATSQTGGPAPLGTAVLYAPQISAHHQLAETMEAEDRSIVLVPLEEPWHRKQAPANVVALGELAASRARVHWPTTPRAVVFAWGPDDPGASLTILARPRGACVVDAVDAQSGAERGRWLVLAASADDGADALALALGADIAKGGLRALQRKLRRAAPGTSVWLRAHPSLASPVWLVNVPRMIGRAGVAAADAPGLAHLGFATPVSVDFGATAARLVAWSHKRRRRREHRRVEELPCKTG